MANPAPASTARAVRHRYFWGTLGEHKLLTAWLVFASVALSAVPALKSALEAAVISEIDDGLSEGAGASFDDLLDRPVEALGASDDAGWIEGLVLDVASLAFNETPLWGAGASYAAIALLAALLAWGSAGARATLARSFFTKLRAHAMRTLMSPRAAPAVRDPDGEEHGTTVQQGARAVATGASGLIQAGQYGLAIITTALVVGDKSGQLLGAIALAVAVQVAIMLFKTRRLAAKRAALERQRDRVVRRSDDIIANRDVIAAHEREPHYAKALGRYAGEFGDTERALARKDQWYRSAAIVMADLGRIGILFMALAIVGGVFGDSADVGDIGDAYFILALYLRMLTPAQNLLDTYDNWRRSRDTAPRFRELLVKPPTDQATAVQSSAASLPEGTAVAFRNVRLLYPADDDRPERGLEDCTFTLPAGKTTLIVGRSGSGKTTIARILLGFLKPQAGEVYIPRRHVDPWKHEQLMEEISYLAQGHHVLDESVRENLFSAADDAALADVLSELGLPIAGASPEAARALLDQGARRLSMGEQQRISFARVLLDDDPIIVMDEPVAGVDAFTFRDLLPHFARLFDDPARTVVVISHRIAFASHADHVVVLDAGVVLEEGSREELLARRGTFYELYNAAYEDLVG